MPMELPPLDGSISVLPGFLDFHVEHNPNQPWGMFPSASETGITAVSYSEYSQATHGIAHVLRPNRQGTEGEVVGVLIHCDTILYSALLVGMVRAGLVPFPMSHRNSAAAIVNLMRQTSAHRLVTQVSLSPLVDAVKATFENEQYLLEVNELPDLYEMFPTIRKTKSESAWSYQPYPGPKTPHSKDDVVLYLHSSGSTGLPKAIPQTHTTILDWCSSPIMLKSREHGLIWASIALPTFHIFGMYAQVYMPLVSGNHIGLYTPQAPFSPVVPTPQNVLEVSRKLGCNTMPMVPAFLEIWAQSDEDVKYLASLRLLGFGGGPLSARSGDKLIAAGVYLCSFYGATEFGASFNIFDVEESAESNPNARTKVDWAWLSFPKEMKHRWVPEGDGSYELHVLTSDTYHPSVENLPDTRGYATKDLFEPHPTKPGLWRITGRKDDVLVLGSGEKIVPIPQEVHITSNLIIAGAVMFGRGKHQCGIIVEPRPECVVDTMDNEAVADFRNKIWPVVEEANKLAPTFARIFKEMIIVAHHEKPLPRAAKSTIIRKQALALYEKEIEELYLTVEDSADIRGIVPPASWGVLDVERWLLQLAADIKRDVLISSSVNVFDQGFDSLHATFLRNRIITTLKKVHDPSTQQASAKITQNFVFDHPTLHELAEAISTVVVSDDAVEDDTVNNVVALIERYSADLPRYKPKTKTNSNIVVLLTGSTGNIGSHILASLLSDSRITTVYTFNRAIAASGDRRQAAAFEERSLRTTLLSHRKLVQLFGDLSLPFFGLTEEIYNEISRTVTHVIHNAWMVNFNHSLKSFEPFIASTRKLIDACYSFSQPIRILYTSSISAAIGHDVSLGPVLEEPLSDPRIAGASGYGASKFVVENLLARVSDNGLSATSLRIGQVCGSKETGAWSIMEWVAVLVKSSVSIGALPDLEGTVSWIPMDAVASATVDLVVSCDVLPCLVNVVHPRPTPWHEVLQNVNKNLGSDTLPFIGMDEWVRRLERLAETATAEDLHRIPAIKLLNFFRMIRDSSLASKAQRGILEAGGLATFSTLKLQAISNTIRNLTPLDEHYAKSWVEYWRRKQFL